MTPKNWHPADIIAAIKKRGSSLRAIAQRAGMRDASMSTALRHPCSGAERAIAAALGLEPADIWPERFWPEGGRRNGNQMRVKIETARARLRADQEAKKAS